MIIWEACTFQDILEEYMMAGDLSEFWKHKGVGRPQCSVYKPEKKSIFIGWGR